MSIRKLALTRILLSASCLSGAAFAMPAMAQTAPAAAGVEEIQITGTRIVRDGYQAPTPVTVAGAEDLQAAAPISLLSALEQLPQLQGSNTSVGGNFTSNVNVVGAPKGNFLNLRGIGAVRTLNMLDGVRIPTNTYTGVVDTGIIPQMLISRVDVVTGGASAAYGSDAVSGVVNFILDKEFTGVKASVQGGVSARGDRYNYRVGAAAGFPLGERGHMLISAERFEADEIKAKDRGVGRDQRLAAAGKFVGVPGPGTAANPLVFYENTTFAGMSNGGHIISTGPLQNIYFPNATTYRPIDPGQATGTPGVSVGGELAAFDQERTLVPYGKEQTGFARVSYDFTDNLSGYVQGLVSAPSSRVNGINLFIQSQTIFSGNAYLPAGLQAEMTARNITSFNLGRIIGEIPGPPAFDRTFNYNVMAGLEGTVGEFTWDASYAHGYARHTLSAFRNEFRRQAAAADAVRDPATGQIVCRVTLTNPGLYPGCVPLNLFGIGSPSSAALAYITENASKYWSYIDSDIFALKTSGDVFDLPAGPVSVAFGGEYRTESLDLQSNADPARPDPITGLRGIAADSVRFYQTNTGVANGSVNVKEVFGEVVVPVVSDVAFARQLDLNGAIRYTDYSTSGGVTTWKVGGTWQVVDDLTLRVTRSRDIRAPNTFELFAGETSSIGSVTDPHTGTFAAYRSIGGGNAALEPEKGDTLTIGGVLSPQFLPGFTMAVDYYDINIKGSIALQNGLTILQLCEDAGGTGAACDLITRPLPFSDRTAANFPTSIKTVSLNAAQFVQRGLDVEASYRRPVADGDLTLRLMANYVFTSRDRQLATLPFTERAGFASGTGSNPPVPELRGTLSARYDTGPWSFYVQERMIGTVKYGNGTSTQIHDEPNPPAVFYTDLTVTARPAFAEAYNGEVFLTVTNVFDPEPVRSAGGNGGGAFVATNLSRYDVIGRAFTFGVRMKM